MAHITTDIHNVYATYFGKDFAIDSNFQAGNYGGNYGLTVSPTGAKNNYPLSSLGTPILEELKGRNIFLPVSLQEQGGVDITFDCCTVRALSKRTIIRTPVPERRGTVKEEYYVGDWQFTLKGVLIGDNRKYPDHLIEILKEIYESNSPISINSVLTDQFMDGDHTIAIESLEFPEVEGKCIWHKPFVLVCESDNIHDLIKINDV